MADTNNEIMSSDDIAEHVAKWNEIASRTGPADRPNAEKYIKKMCKDSGVGQAPGIVWCGSPVSIAIIDLILNNDKLVQSMSTKIKKALTTIAKDKT